MDHAVLETAGLDCEPKARGGLCMLFGLVLVQRYYADLMSHRRWSRPAPRNSSRSVPMSLEHTQLCKKKRPHADTNTRTTTSISQSAKQKLKRKLRDTDPEVRPVRVPEASKSK